MAAVTPQMVKQLRDRTDQPMGLCKQALDQAGGDMDQAITWLQQQNAKMGVKREGNETAEGRITTYEVQRQTVTLTVQRMPTFEVIFSDFDLTDPAVAKHGTTTTPGVLGLLDAMLPELTGIVLDETATDSEDAVYLVPAGLERMFFEPDGSFVWVGSAAGQAWQLDGLLADRAGRLLYVELKGRCPSDVLDGILATFGRPEHGLMFQLVREAVFLDESEFRRYAAAGD